MIQYRLKCKNNHSFDSWFENAAAFEKLEKLNMLSCSICGSSDVSRAMMAPQINKKHNAVSLSKPANDTEKALAALRKEIEANSENVGKRFAQEVRAIHKGESPARHILGEAKPEEAKSLIDDGFSIIPLPWHIKKTN